MWIFVLVFSAIQFLRLRQFQDPTGADGYFYLKQIQSLAEHGQYYFKDYSAAFLPPALLNFFLRDPLLTYQIFCSLYAGVTVILVDRIAQHLWPARSFIARSFQIALLLSLLFNIEFIHLDFVFMKTGAGLLCFLVFVDRLITRRRSSAIAWAVVSVLCHKLFAALLALAMIAWILARLFERKLILAFFSILVVGLLVFIANIVHPGLIEQAKHLVDKIDYSKFSRASMALRWPETEAMLLTSLGAVVALLLATAGQAKARWFFVFSFFTLLAPAVFPDSLVLENVSYRLLVVSFPFLYLIAACALQSKGLLRLIGAAFTIFVVVRAFGSQDLLSKQIFPWSKRLPNLDALVKAVPADAMLYAPHGVEFYLAYKTKFRPRSFLIDAKGSRAYRVALVAPYLKAETSAEEALKDDLDHMSLASLGPEFRVYAETDWRAINDIHLMEPLPMNMLRVRPDFVADY